MDALTAAILGALQGLTEFLPISSSGHLVLAENVLNLSVDPTAATALTVLLHLGSLLAIFIVFRREVFGLVYPRIDGNHISLLAYATLPVVVVGVTLHFLVSDSVKESVEHGVLQSPWVASFGLLVTAVVLLVGDRKREEKVTFAGVSGRAWGLVILVGLAQAMAILPGISRSGMTICVALMLGWGRMDAIRLSFLMGIIAIGGAGVVEYDGITDLPIGAAVVGFASALVFSLLGLAGIKLAVKARKLRWFALYCAVLGVVSLIILASS